MPNASNPVLYSFELRNLDYFFGLCQKQRRSTNTMIRKLRIEDVLAPPGRTATTSGWVTAPDAISNAMETMQ